MRVLIIEDEQRISNFICKGLSENGYKCTLASDGLSGASIALKDDFEIILMDINMPGINGIDLTGKLRKKEVKTPIIILTALSGIEEKISALDAGADDYLVKPFEFQELLARMRVALRRTSQKDAYSETTITLSNLSINLDLKSVKRANQEIELTAKEYGILSYLMRNKNRVISKADLFSEIWDQNADLDSGKVEVYINLLRNKIDKGFSTKTIHTVVGLGYVIKLPDE